MTATQPPRPISEPRRCRLRAWPRTSDQGSRSRPDWSGLLQLSHSEPGCDLCRHLLLHLASYLRQQRQSPKLLRLPSPPSLRMPQICFLLTRADVALGSSLLFSNCDFFHTHTHTHNIYFLTSSLCIKSTEHYVTHQGHLPGTGSPCSTESCSWGLVVCHRALGLTGTGSLY